MSADYRKDGHDDRTLLIVAAEKSVLAFRRDNGQVAWKFEADSSFFNTPRSMDLAIVKSRVFLATSNKIICLDYLTGAVLGQVPLQSETRRPTFLVEDDLIYVATVDSLFCFGLNGNCLWRTAHELSLKHGPAMGIPGNVRQGDEVY